MKNKNAVALGKRGGKAAAANMTPEQRSERARKAAFARVRQVGAMNKVVGCPQDPKCKVPVGHEHINH